MRRLAVFVALLTLGAAIAPAYPRHPPRRHRAAVIVVGKPRPVRRPVVIHGRVHGLLDLNVKPKQTEVWVDGRLRGTCDEFDGFPHKLALLPGTRRIRLVTPDGLEVVREVRVRAGLERNVGLDLR